MSKNAPKKQYLVILTIKDLLCGFQGHFSCRTQQAVLSRHEGSQSQCTIWFILPTHRASHIQLTLQTPGYYRRGRYHRQNSDAQQKLQSSKTSGMFIFTSILFTQTLTINIIFSMLKFYLTNETTITDYLLWTLNDVLSVFAITRVTVIM